MSFVLIVQMTTGKDVHIPLNATTLEGADDEAEKLMMGNVIKSEATASISCYKTAHIVSWRVAAKQKIGVV